MTNYQKAQLVFETLARMGVTEVVACAGARNAPLIEYALEGWGQRLELKSFFEERSAGFYALGRARRLKRPVAVLTTSGTAVSELLSCLVEAHYSGTPLVVITADRPRRYRGTGAPQVIEQEGIFGAYVERCWDLESDEEWKRWTEHYREKNSETAHSLANLSVHWNLCLDEPLLDRPQDLSAVVATNPIFEKIHQPDARAQEASERAFQELQSFLSRRRRVVAVVSGLRPEMRSGARAFLKRLGVPVILEATSHLREDVELAPQRVEAAEWACKQRFDADGVLRIGSVPTLRLWRDLESRFRGVEVFSLSELPFSGLPGSVCHAVPLAEWFLRYGPEIQLHSASAESEPLQKWLQQSKKLGAEIEHLLERFPQSEPGVIRGLSARIPARSWVYVGNSLPIREWDLAATREDRLFELGVSRGANGIDGQVSTFYGGATPDTENWALLGDLTALYDLSAPWACRYLENTRTRLVVINNSGGRIFDRIFKNPSFINAHDQGFESWAALWKLGYVSDWEWSAKSLRSWDHLIMELRPDAGATREFWEHHDRLRLG